MTVTMLTQEHISCCIALFKCLQEKKKIAEKKKFS